MLYPEGMSVQLKCFENTELSNFWIQDLQPDRPCSKNQRRPGSCFIDTVLKAEADSRQHFDVVSGLR